MQVVRRSQVAYLSATQWTDDLQVVWCEAVGVGKIQAVYDYANRGVQARLILRRGAMERTLADGLEQGYARTLTCPLQEHDVVVLQWRVDAAGAVARSDVAELCVEEQPLCQ